MRTTRNVSFLVLFVVFALTEPGLIAGGPCDTDVYGSGFSSWQDAGAYCNQIDCDDLCYDANEGQEGQCGQYIYAQWDPPLCDVYWGGSSWWYDGTCECTIDEY